MKTRFSFLVQNSNEGKPAHNGAAVAYIQNRDSHTAEIAQKTPVYLLKYYF